MYSLINRHKSLVTKSVKVQQFKAACDTTLLWRVYDAGGMDEITTKAGLLAEMKKITVRVIHKTLHMQNLWAMKQSPDEQTHGHC